jgi:hypothetical protein
MTPQFAPPLIKAEQLTKLLPLLPNLVGSRRNLLLAPLLAALPSLLSDPAAAIDPAETQVTLPNQYQWKSWSGAPPHSSETAALFGSTDKPGAYAVVVKWYPGYMSAPHSYATDRLCFVLSGTWWVNSGDKFEPDATVPVSAGGFVRRVARTPHYDGVKKGEPSPVVIGIIGMAPIDLKLVDPSKPPWREL